MAGQFPDDLPPEGWHGRSAFSLNLHEADP
jgi:hypothetical protein